MSNATGEFYPAGGPAPAFSLTAVKSGRTVGNKASQGQVVVLIFHGRETVHAAVEVNTAVRPDFPNPRKVALASVLDLSIVPRLLQGAVKPMLEQAYDQAAREVPKEYDPADFVFLLPDWKGDVTKAFHVKDTGKQGAVVVITPAGQVVGSYQGTELGAQALALVRAAVQG